MFKFLVMNLNLSSHKNLIIEFHKTNLSIIITLQRGVGFASPMFSRLHNVVDRPCLTGLLQAPLLDL
jgi:hypothetical protein